MKRNRLIGLECRDEYDVGRDPRSITTDELERLGHAHISPLRALRLKCLDCCNGSSQEVRLCTAVDCPSWPFRMGRNPYRRKLDQEERAVLRARLGGDAASSPAVAQKTGGQIDSSPSEGVRVPNAGAADFSPTGMDVNEGDAA